MPERIGTKTRRSIRVSLSVAIRIYEPDANKPFVVEDTESVKVSLWGGLVALKSVVNLSQKVVVVNRATGETKEARIVHLGPIRDSRRLVGFEFLESSPNFWGLVFPQVSSHRTPVRSAYR